MRNLFNNQSSVQLTNRENIFQNNQVPIPIEYTYFLEDGEQDPQKFNRYYFNFPADWCTANVGEKIIGVRNIFMLARKRRIEYTMTLRKYYKEDFDKYSSRDYNPSEPNIFDYTIFTSKDIDDNRKSEVTFQVISHLHAEHDLSEYAHDLYIKLEEVFKEYNEQNPNKPLFNFKSNLKELADIKTYGYYDYEKKTYVEKIYSPHNLELRKDKNGKYIDPYFIDIQINFVHRYANDWGKIDMKYDFEDVFNIGSQSYNNYQNNYLGQWLREIKFENVWDRHSCKIYASFADQSNKGYVGNTTVYYNPIKYFKINSTDQRFWIEFYSGRNKDIPVKVPRSESFSIEMQFLPYNKMLYI